MRNFFTVEIYEAESIPTPAGHSYAAGRGFGMSPSPQVARKLAQKACNRDLSQAADKAGWQGMGGTPILRNVKITNPQGKVIADIGDVPL